MALRFKSRNVVSGSDSPSPPENAERAETDQLKKKDGANDVEEKVFLSITERTRSKRKLQGSFLFFLLAGVGFLWVSLFKIEIPIHFSLGVTVAIMGAYWLWVVRELKNPITREVFGDSFYYMGFLFTFVALLFAVIGLHEITISKVVSNMGVALITTIIGLTVRIFYVQFEPIVNATDEEIVETLGELSDQMNTLGTTFNENLKRSIAGIEIYRLETEKQINNLMTGMTNQFGHSVNNFEKSIDEFSNKIKTIELENVFAEAPKLGLAINGISSDLGKLKTSVSDITVGLNKVGVEFSELGLGVNKLARAAVALEQGVPNLENLNNKVESLESATSQTGVTIKAQKELMEENVDALLKKIQEVELASNALRETFETKSLELIEVLRDEAKK
jgi:hypothetical protein